MKILRKISLVAAIILIVFAPTNTAMAITEEERNFYAQNHIIGYDPGSICGNVTNSAIATLDGIASGSGYERLKEAVRTYGEYAMQMQIKWGTPWEVVLAQMQHESSMGTAGIAIAGADNNWLGITGEGDAGSWISSSGRKWAKFTSIEASIDAWAGTKVLRNGMYDDAFRYLNPSNYNLEGFIRSMLSHYAPNSDGNNEDAYANSLLNLINGPIAEVRAEKGWLSSGEYARQNNIHAEGEFSSGSEIEGDLASVASGMVCNNQGIFSGEAGARLAQVAVWMSWPDKAHWGIIKPEYLKALQEIHGNTSLSYAQDCGHFVASVIRYSGVDPNFPLTYTITQHNYLRSSSLWTEVPNTGNTADLQPGDVLVNAGHIMMFVGGYGGGAGNLAQASFHVRTSYILDIGSTYGRMGSFADNTSGAYSIYRFTGSAGEPRGDISE